MKRVLIAEDEDAIREFIVINLKRSGYDVIEAQNGKEALALYDKFNGDFDIALLDIMMPEIDGLEVCKQLRSKSKTIGIVILTAKTQEMDKVTGLLVGADDYVTKPFSTSELMARIDAVYRRVCVNRDIINVEKKTPDVVEGGDFILNLRSRTLLKNGVQIDLTQVEFQIIEYFISNPNTALSRTDILNYVWGTSYFGDEKVVDVNIRRLRMKIEDEASKPKHLTTVWGLGYKWIP